MEGLNEDSLVKHLKCILRTVVREKDVAHAFQDQSILVMLRLKFVSQIPLQ